jgi:AAA+ superfamily predicted ATPase
MRIKINAKMAKQFLAGHPNEQLEDITRYLSDDKTFKFVFDYISEEELNTLEKIAGADNGDLGWDLNRRVQNWRSIQKNAKGVKVKKLDQLAEALKAFLKDAPNHWVFEETEERMMPVLVTNITYIPRNRKKEIEAHVRLDTIHMERGHEKSDGFTWRVDALKGGVTAEEALAKESLFFPSKDMLACYEKSMQRYKQVQAQTGAQFLGSGQADQLTGSSDDDDDSGYRYYSHGSTSLVQEGIPDKLVMDDVHKEGGKYGDDEPVHHDTLWETVGAKTRIEDEEDSEDVGGVVIPIHPYVKMFDLDRHCFIRAHVEQVKDYEWETTLGDKLILPSSHKEVIQILMETAKDQIDDIIRGKSGGTICICTGEPGTGKTLTAEVTSEVIKSPLYKVNCSQLGTDEEAIEKELGRVLTRASRWQALLLIDEADVYVRAREKDIQQNAIVGVFLRVLEYYRGILFLTSNRATVIDDAIMSRSTVHLKYEKPDAEMLKRIWVVLSTQFNLKLEPKLLDQLVKTFPSIVGRDVKNLLKLVIRYSKRGTRKVDIELFKLLAINKDIEPAK